MVELCVKQGFLRARVTPARFPADEGFRPWPQDELSAGNFSSLAFQARSLNRNSLRRIDIDLCLFKLQLKTIYQPIGCRQDETVAAILLLNSQLILE